MQVAIIGGGAAGFFAALSVKEHYPHAGVTIFEKSPKVLAKVKVSGGGRCNVTNGCTDLPELIKAYPRGSKLLKKAFHTFHTAHTMHWFKQRGVALTIQEDGCVFPVSQDSQTIIDCFIHEARRLEIQVITHAGVSAINKREDGQLVLHFGSAERTPAPFHKVIVTTGGSPKRSGLQWLEDLGHAIEEPVPSLFTFNMPQEPIRELMGIVAEEATATIPGTKLKATGPLLVTHWGMSGPAILKLSAFGARLLSERAYRFQTQINWANTTNQEHVFGHLQAFSAAHPQKSISTLCPYPLPKRLWHHLLEKTELPPSKSWQELGKTGLYKIVNVLTNDTYEVSGKTTFKEEFVTCGGVSLDSVDARTMQSKVCPGLYFAGEVLDIDGITGGYNFQAAWTTGFIAGKLGE